MDAEIMLWNLDSKTYKVLKHECINELELKILNCGRDLGLKQVELAEKFGVTERFISKIKSKHSFKYKV